MVLLLSFNFLIIFVVIVKIFFIVFESLILVISVFVFIRRYDDSKSCCTFIVKFLFLFVVIMVVGNFCISFIVNVGLESIVSG